MQHYIVTGIGTNIGKTVCSAVLCEALHADYWKPVQAGDLNKLDSDFVKEMTSNTSIIPERLMLTQPFAPFEAARIDGITIQQSDLNLPHFEKNTIIEGAGGLMVPLNEDGLCFLDVFQNWGLPVFVVTRHYLGSINHTLLTIQALMSRDIPIAGLIVNGSRNDASERIYQFHFPQIKMSFIPEMKILCQETIRSAAFEWKEQLQ